MLLKSHPYAVTAGTAGTFTVNGTERTDATRSEERVAMLASAGVQAGLALTATDLRKFRNRAKRLGNEEAVMRATVALASLSPKRRRDATQLAWCAYQISQGL